MNDEDKKYFELIQSQRPSEVFKRILADASPDSKGPLYLIKRIRSIWKMPLEKVIPVGAWSIFEDGGVADEDIDRMFAELK
jgi:hypothetical protein